MPTEDELVELAHLAAQGIHPPEEMPFEVAWTDELTVEGFLEHHLELRADWSPRAWWFNPAVWCDGELVGTQGMRAVDFTVTRRFVTGSWLGQRHQGRGIGTEMRVAILELGFRGLGGKVAESGAAEGNIDSARVSAKLGYHDSGAGTVTPRGAPIRHDKYELAAEEWQPPLAVDISGLEPCLPLFGL